MGVGIIKSRILVVKAIEISGEGERPFDFSVEEFENGLILVAGTTTNDWYFESRDEIGPCGIGFVSEVLETGEYRDWSTEDLASSIEGSLAEFGNASVPVKYKELVGAES